MKRHLIIIICLLLSVSAYAQQRVIDATDSIPVSVASIFDFDGNVVGYTMDDGTFSEIPETAYPITIRCLGYEPLVIAEPKDTVWQMKQSSYDMPELVVVPGDRNVIKQILYIRNYFSMCNEMDTVTHFVEEMAYRYVPATEDAKIDIGNQIHSAGSRSYSMHKVGDIDSVAHEENSKSFFMTSTLTKLSSKEILVHESLKNDSTGYYEKKGKSGLALVQRLSNGVFTFKEDLLAEKKNHTLSPWPLKLLGFTLEINQFYTTNAFSINEDGKYYPKDLLEAGFMMEAEGRGKYIRMALDSKTPVTVRTMTEIYVVDRDFLTLEEAKEESAKEAPKMDFIIPSNVPAQNEATRRLVERAKAKAGK
ncbi:MAG: hypothetical protein U0L52_09635 [Bacteroidaceae bacterium]|nr:hypothetical protein [Bacteroidaceae bacterium]